MKKRLVSFLLVTLMAVTTVTGCGSSAPAETATTDNYVAADESPAMEAEEAPASYSSSPSNSSAKSDTRDYSEEAAYDTGYAEDVYIPADGETYKDNGETGFTSVAANPLSTFAADVDTASYANMRRFVDQGYGLYDFPEGSIRAEELINYFTYDYEAPKKGDVFGVDATISECPWNRDTKLMVLGITTEEMQAEEKPSSNIVFLVDVSGSMNNANKLPLLKNAMELLVDNLDEKDRVSIVTYASGTNVVIEGVPGSEHRTIMRAFNGLKAGGGTNGEGGIQLAYKIAEENFIDGGNNRVILATDGDFNIGCSDENSLRDLISEKKESKVFLSVFGFGMGNYNDVTAETLADAGNGNYSYIDSLSEAKKVLVDEMNQTLFTVAKDTKLQVEFNPALVSEYRLVGYENRRLNAEDFKDDTKDGGELGAGHQVTAVYEIKLADFAGSNSELKYQESQLTDKGASMDEWCTLSIAYKQPEGNKSMYMEFPIGVNNYTKNPSDDFKFVTAVAEYAMALSDSENLKDMSREEAVEQAYKTVTSIKDKDEYKYEFEEILGIILGNATEQYWYD